MRLKDKIRLGEPTRKHIHEPASEQQCLNCGASYHGSYCPHCGQSHDVSRITLSRVITSFVTNIVGLQANLPRTLLDLFYRPGHLIHDYLAGKRQVYSNPWSTLPLLATIYILMDQLGLSSDIRALTSEYGESIGQELFHSMGGEPSGDPAVDQSTLQAIDLIYDNYGLFSLLTIPLITIPLWIAFRREGPFATQSMNIAEAATIGAFLSCQNMVINIIILPIMTVERMTDIAIWSYSVMALLYILTVWQLLGIGAGRFVWRNIVFVLSFLVFAIVSFFVCCFVVGTYMVFT